MKVITAGGTLDLGTTETTPTIGIIDYSRRVTDDFGITTVVERGFSRRMSLRFALPFGSVDSVQQQLAALRATSCRWIGEDGYAWLDVTGFYKDFSLDLNVPPLSFCTLTVEGLAETEVVADAGGDPATAGLQSDLRMLRPTIVTGAMLTASSVPENDYLEWAAGTAYVLGARVIKAATHRIYESVIGGNAGNDPAASDKWIDVGPTNRWAMFDRALGSVTSGASPLAVTLNPGVIDAVALLDVVGAAVRVQAGGYDQTIAVGAGAIVFTGLPATGAAVTVTITGPAPVKVGTLLVGRMLALGVTEASPTAEISDFSRKEVDDFGGVTVVQRAWAKRMSANGLIRSDAVDVVANRIAAVRAVPTLWIGSNGIDSLTVFGFFKDFSIEIGETVSKLSLSIEGLSKAAPSIGDPLAEAQADIVRLDAELEALGATVGGQGDQIGTAIALAQGKGRPWFQTTPPTAAESSDQDLWFDIDDNGIMYRRVPGNGRISIGGTVVTFGGVAPLYRPWAPAPDQRIAQGLVQAALAIEQAQAAQLTADDAIASLESLADDGELTGVEKKQLKIDDGRLEASWAILDAQAATFGIVAERTAAANARSAWLALRNGLVPAWDDVAADTAVDRVAFRSALTTYDAALTALQKAISAKAATTADWSGVTGAGKDQLLSDAATAKANAATALGQIVIIQSDGYLSAAEKPDIIRQRIAIEAEYPGLVAKAVVQGVPVGTYQAAYTALTAYLDGLTPAWNNTALDTAIVAATFNGRFTDYYYARTALVGATADLTLANVPTFTIATSLDVPADYTFVIAPNTLPKYITPDVKVGGVDKRTDNLSSYSLSNWTGGCTNSNTTIDNGAGSATKGRLAIDATWNATGTVDVTFSFNGVAIKTERITITKKPANPPSGSGSGTGGYTKNGSFDATGLSVSTTGYAVVGQVLNMAKAAGETIRGSFGGTYDASGSGNVVNRTMLGYFRYSLAGANSWTAMGTAVTGSSAQMNNLTGDSAQGSITVSQAVAPGDGNYDVQFVAAINSSVNGAALTFAAGGGSVIIS